MEKISFYGKRGVVLPRLRIFAKKRAGRSPPPLQTCELSTKYTTCNDQNRSIFSIPEWKIPLWRGQARREKGEKKANHRRRLFWRQSGLYWLLEEERRGFDTSTKVRHSTSPERKRRKRYLLDGIVSRRRKMRRKWQNSFGEIGCEDFSRSLDGWEWENNTS